MNKLIDYLIDFLLYLKTLDKAKFAQEMRELTYLIKKQSLSQIPNISAITGILIGSWVASTFTTSPVRGFLASWGIIKGGTRVVSSTTYKFLSVSLPIIAVAITAYAVQKALKIYRERELAKDTAVVAQLGPEVQSELLDRMNILGKAKEAGLISEGEYRTKKSVLYQSYARTSQSKIKDFIINKMA